MMYYKKLKDYGFNRALEMIRMDQENLADDYLSDDVDAGWMSFISDPGLTFFLVGEGPVPLGLKLDDVIEDQFSWMKIDLALAYALVVKNDFGDHGPETPEQSDNSDRIWNIIRDIGVVDLFPCYGMSYTARQNQLFKIYQIRRRIHYSFRGLAPDGYSQQFLVEALGRVTTYLESVIEDDYWIIGGLQANDAIHYLVDWLVEKGEAGPGRYLSIKLYDKGVLVGAYDNYYDDDDDDDDYYD